MTPGHIFKAKRGKQDKLVGVLLAKVNPGEQSEEEPDYSQRVVAGQCISVTGGRVGEACSRAIPGSQSSGQLSRHR